MLSLANKTSRIKVALLVSCGINTVILGVHRCSYCKCFFIHEPNVLYTAHTAKAPKKLFTAFQMLDSAVRIHSLTHNSLCAKSFWSMCQTELLAVPVICSVSHGLLWVPGASSLLQTSFPTFMMLADVLADLARLLPTARSALPLPLIRLSKLSGALLDLPLGRNSLNSFFESHLFCFRKFSIKILSLTFILPISQSIHTVMTSHFTSYIEYLIDRIFNTDRRLFKFTSVACLTFIFNEKVASCAGFNTIY